MSLFTKLDSAIFELSERYDSAPDSKTLWMGYVIKDLEEVRDAVKELEADVADRDAKIAELRRMFYPEPRHFDDPNVLLHEDDREARGR